MGNHSLGGVLGLEKGTDTRWLKKKGGGEALLLLILYAEGTVRVFAAKILHHVTIVYTFRFVLEVLNTIIW